MCNSGLLQLKLCVLQGYPRGDESVGIRTAKRAAVLALTISPDGIHEARASGAYNVTHSRMSSLLCT